MHAKGWFPSSVVSPGVFGTVATLGTVAAGVAIVEAALIPGLFIGAAAVLVPRLLHRDMLSGLGDRLRRAVPSSAPVPSAPKAHSGGRRVPAKSRPSTHGVRSSKPSPIA